MMKEVRLEGRTVAVTGAAGFIGHAVGRHLAAQGASVIGIDAAPDTAERINAERIEARIADVTDPAAIRTALEGAEMVVHTAARVTDAGTMDEHIAVNVGGTVNVLDAAADLGVKRVVHLSSVVVYGFDDPSVQDESAHLRTCGVPYIDTKSASDRLARRRGASVVRPGDVYGPGSVPWTIRPLALAQAGAIAVPGQGAGRMLAIYIDDLVAAIGAAVRLGEPGAAYAAWNDSESITFEEFFSHFTRMAGSRPPRRLPRPVMEAAGLGAELWAGLSGNAPAMTRHSRVLIDRRGSVSTRRLREDLGWEPVVGIEEGIALTERWLRESGIL